MMENTWQLQDAKARFSELFTKAQTDGPQKISRHGKEIAYIVSEKDFQKNQRENFVDFLLSAPKIDLDIERIQDHARELEL
ncbi:MAG TPA: type II toxin-antitoxin system prevent-host-death family antitoxin [Treponemataceae bacterium]|jgi:antitoxin Phd|nr:type II toxin-antitoxin system prevent-host-death family antitoxin [Treponemataceae bacterium]HPM06964.1 type II toxin-antitoxin system prevent-host-death family antitoxin [Treponemataceae bacterium]